jgi:hypothetical protein
VLSFDEVDSEICGDPQHDDAMHRRVSKKLAQWRLSIPNYGALMRLMARLGVFARIE